MNWLFCFSKSPRQHGATMQKPFLVLQKTLKINQTLSIDLERHSLHKHFSKTFFFHFVFLYLLHIPIKNSWKWNQTIYIFNRDSFWSYEINTLCSSRSINRLLKPITVPVLEMKTTKSEWVINWTLKTSILVNYPPFTESYLIT